MNEVIPELVPAAAIEDEELPADPPQFFTSLSEIEETLPQDEEREEEEDEKEEEALQDLEKIDSGLFENVRLSINSVYQDIVDEYGMEDGTLRRLLEDDAAKEFGYGEDDDQFFEAYVDVDVLFVGDTPLGLYKGRVFRLDNNENLRDGLESMEEYADDAFPADSFRPSAVSRNIMKREVVDAVEKVREVQRFVLRNASNDLLREIIRRSKFFDAFIDKDMVREALSKRTGRGKMKGGKFFLSDLLDMIMGKRHLEY